MVRGVCPRTISFAVVDPRAEGHVATPEERACLNRVAPTRLRAFDAGRSAARQALRDLGVSAPVLVGADGAPAWPNDITGSIAHSESCALAVVARQTDHIALGVDVEEDRPLEPDLIPSICSDAEQARLPLHESGRAAMAVFCAKEAAYKCQYPLTGQMLDFDAFDVTFQADRFTARFARRVGRFAAGTALPGRIGTAGGVIVALVALQP